MSKVIYSNCDKEAPYLIEPIYQLIDIGKGFMMW
jgi:hypothetical protein